MATPDREMAELQQELARCRAQVRYVNPSTTNKIAMITAFSEFDVPLFMLCSWKPLPSVVNKLAR